jgi:hypothetical protein
MEGDYLDKYDDLVKLITECVIIDGKEYKLSEEFDKFFVHSNKAAGVRIRKIMQMVRDRAYDIRGDVQEYKSKI